MEILIENSSDVSDIVFDAFSGVGGFALACIRTKRNYIGFEIDKEYFDKSSERIEVEKSQLKLDIW